MPDYMKDYEVYFDPTSENRYTAKIPEPDSDNIGKTGFSVVADRIFSPRLKFQAIIENSGGMRPRVFEASPRLTPTCGRFVVKPISCKNSMGYEEADTYSGMGAEANFAPCRAKMIQPGAGDLFHSIRIIELQHHHNFDEDQGVLGIAIWGKWNGANKSDFYRSLILEGPSGGSNYIFDSPTQVASLYDVNSAVRPSFGILEWTDGSIYLVVSEASGLKTLYRSIDMCVTWDKVSTFYIGVNTQSEIFLTRINERMIICENCFDTTSTILRTSYSDDFGYTWSALNPISSIVGDSTWNPVDITRGHDGKLYMVFSYPDGGDEFLCFSGTLDGINWDTPVLTIIYARDASLIQDYTGTWCLYVVDKDGENIRFSTITTTNPIIAWGNPAILVTETHDVATTEVEWEHMAVRFMNKNGYLMMLGSINYTGTSGGTYSSSMNRIQLGMWSGVPMYNNGAGKAWDVSWISYCYPGTTDGKPHTHFFTVLQDGTGASDLTLYGLQISRTTTGASSYMYYRHTGNPVSAYLNTGYDIRFELSITSGTFIVSVNCRKSGTQGCDIKIIFKSSNNTVVIYDLDHTTILGTYTCSNWTLAQYNVFHIIGYNNKIAVFRSGDQFYETLHFEQLLNEDFTYGGDDSVNLIDFYVGDSGIDAVTSDVYLKSFFINFTAGSYPLASSPPYLDQDEDIVGRACYYNPVGFMQGLAFQFDGPFVQKSDSWYADVGAIYEPENLLLPSPSVGWKSNDTTPTDQLLYFRRKADYAGNARRKLAYGIAFFGKNWLNATIQNSIDGSDWQTLSTADTHWYIQKGIASATSRDNIIPYTPPAAGLYEGQFASTPEISYFVVAKTGTLAYKVCKIVDCDSKTLVVDEFVGADISSSTPLFIFSDRIYLNTDTLTLADTRYLLITIKSNGYTYPDCDDALVKLGSICFGPIYDLPDDEWASQMTYAPKQSVFESRGSIKEVVNLAPARRSISLQYTGITESNFGKSQPLDLARITQWGVYPIVYLDDDTIFDTNNRSHHYPILTRVVDGVKVQRDAYDSQTEDQGHGTTQGIIKTISTITIDLEEIL